MRAAKVRWEQRWAAQERRRRRRAAKVRWEQFWVTQECRRHGLVLGVLCRQRWEDPLSCREDEAARRDRRAP